MLPSTPSRSPYESGREPGALQLGERLPRGRRLAFWAQAEVVAAATDLAEVIGGAIALHILFGIPLLAGGVIVGVVSMLLLAVQTHRGPRHFEFVMSGLLAIITVGFVTGLFLGPVDWGEAVAGVLPRLEGTPTVLLAASMLGATVMPHAIYAHSALARDRHGLPPARAALPQLLTATRWDVLLSLLVAGSVNIAMLLLAAGNLSGVPGTDSIEGAHAAIVAALGPGVGIAFGVGLLASGLASTSVGCYAGSAIMGGLLHVRLSVFTRRLITLVPALVVIAAGVDPTWALVLSQVLLSLGIPFALVPLVRLTGDRAVMGVFVNRACVSVVAWVVVALIVALNLALLVLTAAGGG
ncbi:Nramp family divalent metal transporter [Ornithinimicrobium avium]|uniref:Divalent metal cation transporter n=1 Tax=Ornithinimicrobium avium TaxID=2283195 RepID=A0A345NLN4_9MICO|nr:Nramp family divalent metal transporter [Ornithinimicrobium avium]AXH95942.1 divalent metal cation transporter [Ornithinimicrobium avium]